jgi:glucoamylase
VLGVPIGRYPEDIYNGTGTQVNGGNPWYLTTAAVAQYFWAASAEYSGDGGSGSIAVTTTSQSFFDYFAPSAHVTAGESYSSGSAEFTSVIDTLNGWGDAFARTAKAYTPADSSLAEEYNRDTGAPQGCVDLTWSYASIITAAIQRASLRNDTAFVQDLANLGFTPNR